MSDPFPPVATAPTPGYASPDRPTRPDLPTQRVGPSYADDLRFAFERPVSEPAEVKEAYAHWGLRVGAVVIDALLPIPFLVAQVVGLLIAYDGGGLARTEQAGSGIWNDTYELSVQQMTTDTWIGLAIFSLAGTALTIFRVRNNIVRQGRTGASIGKQCMNIVVVSERDGRPIGSMLTWLRTWVHLIDLLALGLGYLWPLWDRKRQTFTDMIMGTVVLHLPPQPARTAPQVQAQITPTYDW